MFINYDGEVEEIKATLEDFDYLADNGNWGIDASPFALQWIIFRHWRNISKTL
jgi:hypothetical protein